MKSINSNFKKYDEIARIAEKVREDTHRLNLKESEIKSYMRGYHEGMRQTLHYFFHTADSVINVGDSEHDVCICVKCEEMKEHERNILNI